MTDYYLKFPDEATSLATLYRTEGAIEANLEMNIEASPGRLVANYANIDVLGTLYVEQEIADPENPPTPVSMDGWHVNVRAVPGEDEEALKPYAITPVTPRRVWA